MQSERPDRERLMLAWDRWRKLLSEGAGGSFPRDEFESWVDAYEEHIDELQAAHPDWSLLGRLEAGRESLREQMTLLKKAEGKIAELEGDLVRILATARDYDGDQT